MTANTTTDNDNTTDNNNNNKRPLRVLFLSDETGGGHLASAEALGEQVRIYYILCIYTLYVIYIYIYISHSSHSPSFLCN
jgi:hypothetical protein